MLASQLDQAKELLGKKEGFDKLITVLNTRSGYLG